MYDQNRLSRTVGLYLRSLAQGELTEKYIREQRRILKRFRNHCYAHGVRSPRAITPEIAREFLLQLDGLSVTWQKTVAVAVRSFLKFAGNPAALNLKVKMKGTSRTTVRWLSSTEIDRIFATPMKPATAVMVYLGLLMGLRMCEILRVSRVEAEAAVRTSTLQVHGKGFKARQVPVHPDMMEVLKDYLKLDLPRRGRNPDLLLGFGKARAEDLLDQLEESSGVEICGFHTLRRTCGRQWWLAKDDSGRPMVETEVISELLGHKDTSMTRVYLGIDLQDMRKAMACYKVARGCTFSR